MRCIWSTTASNALHVLAGRGPTLSSGRAAFSRAAHRPSKPAGQLLFPTTMRVSATSAAISHSHTAAVHSVSVQDAVDTVPESSTSLPNLLKPSKIAFAAAQAIRMCIGNSGIADGFFVLNSLRYAAYRAKASALPFKMPGMLHSKVEFEAAALQFGPNVSQRLPAHALLHGLLRNGLAEAAFELSKLMMAEGVVIRSATLEAVIKSLVSVTPASRPVASQRLSFSSPSPAIPLKLASDVLMLRPFLMADQRSRLALQLLFLARRHRQRRTDNMFKLIMAASLLNGELIIFSLLFGWTCREWQTAYSLECNLAAIPEDDELQSSSQVTAARYRYAHLRMEALVPDKQSMESALTVISTILARHGEAPTPTHDRLVALQALGNLVGLLDRRQIPFPQIATLLRTMYKCPRMEDEIWIVGAGGCPERIKAYEYFHRVLADLIHTLPTEHPRLQRPAVPPDAIVKSPQYAVLPPLGLGGYNALLHYALRHRLSPALGEVVLSHMIEKRWVPVAPDKVTADILLRSGTLLRRNDIVAKVLESMGTITFSLSNTADGVVPQTDQVVPQPDEVVPQSDEVVLQPDGEPDEGAPLPDEVVPPHLAVLPQREFPPHLEVVPQPVVLQPVALPDAIIHSGPVSPVRTPLQTMINATRLGQELGRISMEEITVPDLPSQADVYNLTSYVAYLTSTGQTRAVKDLLFAVIPELRDPRHHERGNPGHVTALARAIVLGPVFLTAVLNALTKPCRPALADRIWTLAKKAEESSWSRLIVPDREPWIFGPEVYTVMIRCYARMFHRKKDWVLRAKEKRLSWSSGRRTVWDAFIYKCQGPAGTPWPPPTERVQVYFRRAMMYAASDVFRRFVNLREVYDRVPELQNWLAVEDLPKPDARFLNAAVYAFRPHMGAKPKSWYEARLTHETYMLDQYGVIESNPGWLLRRLHEVALRMLDNGYSVPLGLKHFLVRRLGDVDDPGVERLVHGPHGYGQLDEPRKFRPYLLPTRKRRGLPVAARQRHR
ncbi:hypothetical protein B0H17DRAFT_1089578 [Mycena rosella]|uniref:Uncharacterized protein n=1 Tax=Mycena rosella TaxID=1033263 RepID=A0AAD7G780_MYCRO|nr:hypothetical protein B0H17DRAFT_1089578 [Mycena rosella]